jgi:hypothetical protein
MKKRRWLWPASGLTVWNSNIRGALNFNTIDDVTMNEAKITTLLKIG